jgi:RteC protein
VNRKTTSSEEQLDKIHQSLEQLRILLFTNLGHNLTRHLLENKPPVSVTNPGTERLQWTYSKNGLTELSYSLWKLGVFNHGKAELKAITRCFEYTFNVDLGNVTSTYQEMLQRKKGYTNFIDKLREVFIKKINDSLND